MAAGRLVKGFSQFGATKPLDFSPVSRRLCRALRSRRLAAPAARSWVGWVRVVGAADVIDALDAWQKHPLRRRPSPGQHRSGSFGSRSELFPAGAPQAPADGSVI